MFTYVRLVSVSVVYVFVYLVCYFSGSTTFLLFHHHRLLFNTARCVGPVSYTHLDVYKRQLQYLLSWRDRILSRTASEALELRLSTRFQWRGDNTVLNSKCRRNNLILLSARSFLVWWIRSRSISCSARR